MIYMQITKPCPTCGVMLDIDTSDGDFYLEPFPSVVCPCCGNLVPLF